MHQFAVENSCKGVVKSVKPVFSQADLPHENWMLTAGKPLHSSNSAIKVTLEAIVEGETKTINALLDSGADFNIIHGDIFQPLNPPIMSELPQEQLCGHAKRPSASEKKDLSMQMSVAALQMSGRYRCSESGYARTTQRSLDFRFHH